MTFQNRLNREALLRGLLGFTLALTWTFPAQALRQVEADEAPGKARQQLRTRLGAANQGNFPGGSLSPEALPAEEVAPQAPVVSPAGERSIATPEVAAPVARSLEKTAASLLADPEGVVSDRLRTRGYVRVPGGILARSDLGELSGRVLIQSGLEEPTGMPEGASLVWVNESSVSGMLGLLNALEVNAKDSVVLNGGVFSRAQAAAVLPVIHPMPPSAVLSPSARVTARELAVILYVAQETGMLYVIGVVQLTWPGHTETVLYLRQQK